MECQLLMVVQRDSLLCKVFSGQKQLSVNVDQLSECGSFDGMLQCSVKF